MNEKIDEIKILVKLLQNQREITLEDDTKISAKVTFDPFDVTLKITSFKLGSRILTLSLFERVSFNEYKLRKIYSTFTNPDFLKLKKRYKEIATIKMDPVMKLLVYLVHDSPWSEKEELYELTRNLLLTDEKVGTKLEKEFVEIMNFLN